MVTIKDIAKYTGVSPTTVSNVIHGRDSKVSPETREKVQKALEELNYSANMGGRLLANHGSKIIGMIIQDNEAEAEEFYDNPYYGELIQAIESQIKAAGYFMMFHRVSNFEEGAKLAETWRLESLIVSGASAEDISKWEKRVKVPVVFVDTYGGKKNKAKLNVGIRDQEGAYDLTNYLIEKGHEKIIFLAKGEESDKWIGADFERAQGVKKAMSEKKLTPLFLGMPTTYKYYQSFVNEVLQEKIQEYTAIFCASDLIAVQVISELYKTGTRIPKDVSIVSFDGTLFSKYATPQITSMSQDISVKAASIVKLALQGILSQEEFNGEIILETELIEGESVLTID